MDAARRRAVVGAATLGLAFVLLGLAPVVEGLRMRSELERVVREGAGLLAGEAEVVLEDVDSGYASSTAILRVRPLRAGWIAPTTIGLRVLHGPLMRTRAGLRLGMGAVEARGADPEGALVFTYGGRVRGRLRWVDPASEEGETALATLELDLDRETAHGALRARVRTLEGREGLPATAQGLDLAVARGPEGTHLELGAPYVEASRGELTFSLTEVGVVADLAARTDDPDTVVVEIDELRASAPSRDVRLEALSLRGERGPSATGPARARAAIAVAADELAVADDPFGRLTVDLGIDGADRDALRAFAGALDRLGDAPPATSADAADAGPPDPTVAGPVDFAAGVAEADRVARAAVDVLRASSLTLTLAVRLERGEAHGGLQLRGGLDGARVPPDLPPGPAGLLTALSRGHYTFELATTEEVARAGVAALLARFGDGAAPAAEVEALVEPFLLALEGSGIVERARGERRFVVELEADAATRVGGAPLSAARLEPADRVLARLFPPVAEVTFDRPEVRGRRSLGAVIAELGATSSELRRCADVELGDSLHTAEGALSLAFAIAPEGRVSDLVVTGNTLGVPGLDLCFANVVSALAFSPGARADVILPVRVRRAPGPSGRTVERLFDPIVLLGYLLSGDAAPAAPPFPELPPVETLEPLPPPSTEASHGSAPDAEDRLPVVALPDDEPLLR